MAEESLDLSCLCDNEPENSTCNSKSDPSSPVGFVSSWVEQARTFPGVKPSTIGEAEDLARLVTAAHYPHSIFVDCTASDEV